MKKVSVIMLCAALMLTAQVFVSCAPKKEVGIVLDWRVEGTKEYDLDELQYAVTSLSQEINADDINLMIPPITTYDTGEKVSVTSKLLTALPDNKPYIYFIADWGDGTWSYNGPYMGSASKKSTAELTHVYKTAGSYKVKTAAVDLATGTLYGWSEEGTLDIVGDAFTPDNLITNVKPVASSAVSDHGAEKLIDCDASTYFLCGEAEDSDKPEWAGLLFDKQYKLSNIEIMFPSSVSEFASNIAIEYTTDGGKTWYSLPKYYYLYDYSIGRYSPIMKFPNPKGATLSLPLDGITANGIRFSAKLFLREPRQFAVSEMRVYGDSDLLLYSSYGGAFDADVNNMWTIYGTAQTEPIVYGSIKGEATNTSPFRTGSAMIGSTEWMEWNGLKCNWTDYDKFKDAYRETLIDTRYGSDGWGNDGYIYATPDAPQHLDVQNHYTYNSTYIIALRNYLLTGNNTVISQDGEQTDFMKIENRLGQSIEDKLNVAMEYQLTALEGSSGILTINDPRNDGTVNGVASNYWDVFKSFGYKSAYENSLFYASLLAMADIQKAYYCDDEKAKYYTDLAAKAKTEFNKLFWDEAKGRYITSVNVEGYRADFGMTFVNFYAIAYGVADSDKAVRVYEWLDGKRIVEGDTSQGSDIYDRFKYAPRANTLDVSSTGAPYYWWDHNGALPCTPGTFGGYDHTMQNGGTIFYISHYDIMGRISALGADNAFDRFTAIMSEFHKDSLRRNQYVPYVQNGQQGIGEYCEGVIGEFPESGLVPLTFVNGFLGIKPTADGLGISANLPSGMKYAGIREYMFGNRTYSIQVSSEVSSPKVQKHGDKYFVVLPSNKDYVITLDNRLIEK